jgi:hypothetical protein
MQVKRDWRPDWQRDQRRYLSGWRCRARMPSHESRGLKDDGQAGWSCTIDTARRDAA